MSFIEVNGFVQLLYNSFTGEASLARLLVGYRCDNWQIASEISVSDTHTFWLLLQIFKTNNVKGLNSLINSFLLDTAVRNQIEIQDLLIG